MPDNVLSKLTCELQQRENVNPQGGHEMPIPGRHVHKNSLRVERFAQQGRNDRIAESEHATQQVNGVRGRQQVNERTARAGRDKESAISERAPREKLANEKTDSEKGCDVQPGPGSFVSERDSGNVSNGRERRLPIELPTRQLDGEAAQDEENRINDQKLGGQCD